LRAKELVAVAAGTAPREVGPARERAAVASASTAVAMVEAAAATAAAAVVGSVAEGTGWVATRAAAQKAGTASKVATAGGARAVWVEGAAVTRAVAPQEVKAVEFAVGEWMAA